MTRTIRAAELEVIDIGAEISFVQAGWEIRAVLGAVRQGPGAVSLAPEGRTWSERALRPGHDVTVLRESPTRAQVAHLTPVTGDRPPAVGERLTALCDDGAVMDCAFTEITETETGFEGTVSVFPNSTRLMTFSVLDEETRS